jgi:hypothetical protein
MARNESPFINARLHKADSAPPTETTGDSEQAGSRASDSKASDPDNHIFDLLPPKPAEAAAPDPEPREPEPQGRNPRSVFDLAVVRDHAVRDHPVDMTHPSRLSDHDGRLYWGGKPVEVRRRISMSRAQVVGASIVAAFVVIGVLASAIQGVVAARELARRFGWSASACTLPGAVQPRHGSDIPA